MPSLASLRLPALLAALAEGLALVAEHVAALERIAERQEGAEAGRAVKVLRVVADEEAGKFLILLDVARAAFADNGVKADQFRKAGDHIAKGIYARAAELRAADFAEQVRFADLLRVSHYLDGPNDIDWIFRNEIEAEREEKLYVDYVASDDGDAWVSPSRYDDLGFEFPSGAVRLVASMARAGFCAPEVLAAIADVWRDFHPAPKTHWSECVALNKATIERIPVDLVDDELSDSDISAIIDTWPFPMYELDLSKIKVDLDELRERQRAWDPDGYRLEDYY